MKLRLQVKLILLLAGLSGAPLILMGWMWIATIRAAEVRSAVTLARTLVLERAAMLRSRLEEEEQFARMIADTVGGDSDSEMRSDLSHLVLSNPDIAGVAVLRRDGTPAWQSQGAGVEPVPEAMLAKGGVSRVTVLSGRTGRRIAVVETLPDGDRYLLLILTRRPLVQVVEVASRGDHVQLQIIERHGAVLLGAEENRTLTSAVVKDCISGHTQVVQTRGAKGLWHFVAYTWVPQIDMGVIATRARQVPLFPVTRPGMVLALFACGGCISLIALAYLVSRWIARPIVVLQEGAKRIGEGDMQHRLDLRTGDEIEALADSFNTMSSKLAEAHRRLEEMVRKRTSQVGEAHLEVATLRQLNEAVVNGIPSSILIFDDDLRLVYANDVFFTVWRRSRDDIGKHITDMLSAEVVKQEKWDEMLSAAIRTGTTFHKDGFEHRSLHRGVTRIRFHIVRLTNRTTGAHNALVIIDDVTEQELLQRQLVHSDKLAALGQLSAGVAHEIRTPLSVIRLAAYDVKDVLHDAHHEIREQLDLIEKNVLQCNSIVENLLAFARESKHEPQPVDIRQVIQSCLDIARKEFQMHGIEVLFEPPALPPVMAGMDELKQVFSNLILNAVQAMENGGTLTIRSEVENGMVTVEVEDTGHGVAPEHIEHIFDPFFTTKEAGQGTGLGLSICRNIIEKMNGTIQVESELGERTLFRVRLPLQGVVRNGQSAHPVG